MSHKDSVSENLAIVRDAAKRLNEITDQAAETVRAVEEYLNTECSVGVEATVEAGRSTEHIDGIGTVNWYSNLTYCRVGPRFRIAVIEGDDYRDEDTLKPWSDCTREIKLETFKALPRLVAAVADEVRKMIADAETSVGATREILAAVRK